MEIRQPSLAQLEVTSRRHHGISVGRDLSAWTVSRRQLVYPREHLPPTRGSPKFRSESSLVPEKNGTRSGQGGV